MRFRPHALLAFLCITPVVAQEHAHHHDMPEATFQDGSGTSWLPAVTPHEGMMTVRGAWDLMLHYNVFAGVVGNDADDGTTEGFTTNWVMGMAQWKTKGTLLLRGMLSFEEPFLGRNGYPLLMQTGEGLVDRQHSHDLFMELAAKYDLPVGGGTTFEAYVAPVGEPALGPPAFPHRPSAATNPLAPLGHHWEDSTHISFGVVTAGAFWKHVKVEGSAFNGREPDADRYDIDLDPLDSYSARVSFNPSGNWSAQVSSGRLHDPEQDEPGVDVWRTTASVSYEEPGSGSGWATTLAWGRNDPSDGAPSDAWLLESSLAFGPHAIFARAEYVEKDAREFEIGGPDERLPVGDLAAGYSHRILERSGVLVDAGGRVSTGFVGSTLADRYGTPRPWSAAVFLRVHPTAMHH